MKSPLIHSLPIETLQLDTPDCFTYPFYYQPHPLCIAAAECVKAELSNFPEWNIEKESGKMFGVLVVLDTKTGERGFLAAYSGNIQFTKI